MDLQRALADRAAIGRRCQERRIALHWTTVVGQAPRSSIYMDTHASPNGVEQLRSRAPGSRIEGAEGYCMRGKSGAWLFPVSPTAEWRFFVCTWM